MHSYANDSSSMDTYIFMSTTLVVVIWMTYVVMVVHTQTNPLYIPYMYIKLHKGYKHLVGPRATLKQGMTRDRSRSSEAKGLPNSPRRRLVFLKAIAGHWPIVGSMQAYGSRLCHLHDESHGSGTNILSDSQFEVSDMFGRSCIHENSHGYEIGQNDQVWVWIWMCLGHWCWHDRWTECWTLAVLESGNKLLLCLLEWLRERQKRIHIR
jgi:hypothetical protein